MTVEEVLQKLEALGSEQTKKTFLRHGAREPFFGVRIGDMKKLDGSGSGGRKPFRTGIGPRVDRSGGGNDRRMRLEHVRELLVGRS